MNTKYVSPKENVPRKLTEGEINHIVSIIPLANQIFPEVGKMIQKGFQGRLRYLLGKTPLSVGVPEYGNEFGEGIIRMRNEIIRQYRDSQVMAGESVGILAAGAVGEIMTQSTLNTFHSIGKNSNTTTGIRGFREIINVSGNRSNPSSTIHFKDKTLDLRGVLKFGDEIIYTTVKSLVKDYGPEDYQDIFDHGKQLPYWYDLYIYIYNINHNSDGKIYEMMPNFNVFLRLYLDTTAMYSKGITMKEVCRELERKEWATEHSPSSILCIPSPFSVGIIDIFPINENIPMVSSQLMSVKERNRAFISISVMYSLDKIALRGIKGIIGLDPAHFPLVLIIEDEEYIGNKFISGDESIKVREKWKLTLSRRKFKSMGIGISHIEKLLNAVKITIDSDILNLEEIEGATIPIEVLMPETIVSEPLDRMRKIAEGLKNEDKSVLAALIKSIIESETSYDKEKWLVTIDLKVLKEIEINLNKPEEEKVDIRRILTLLDKLKFRSELVAPIGDAGNVIRLKFIIPSIDGPKALIGKSINEDRNDADKLREMNTPRPPSELKKASRYYYAFTIDSNVPTHTQNNLSDLLQKDFIDPRYTYSNNVRFNLEEFGIEAARNFLIKEFLDVISADGSSVNIQHILLLVDHMTRTGSITKISMTMVNKSMGTLGKITVANAMKELLTAAAFGVVDKISGVSASIMVGKHVNIGTIYGEKNNFSPNDPAFAEYKEYEKVLTEIKKRQQLGTFVVSVDQINSAVEEMSGYNFGLDSTSEDRPVGILRYPTSSIQLNDTPGIENKEKTK